MLKDIEIICINDCSTDNSLEILNNYANKYSNLKIIDCEENGGESVARNKGLDIATGEYLAFVDNDDTIDLDFYEKLYKKAKDTNADIVKGNAKKFDYSGLNYTIGKLNKNITETKSKWRFNYEWWTAIYKTSLIKENNIKLPEGYVLGGDSLFLHQAIKYCKKLEIIDDTYYHWRRRINSGESEILSLKKITSALEIFDKILDSANDLYKDKFIDINSYKIVIEHCLSIPFDYCYRNNLPESKQNCAEFLINYYNKIENKNISDKYISKSNIILLDAIKKSDINNVCNILMTYPDKKQYGTKNLLMKLRKNMNQKNKDME